MVNVLADKHNVTIRLSGALCAGLNSALSEAKIVEQRAKELSLKWSFVYLILVTRHESVYGRRRLSEFCNNESVFFSIPPGKR
jgi:hypothetical protein